MQHRLTKMQRRSNVHSAAPGPITFTSSLGLYVWAGAAAGTDP